MATEMSELAPHDSFIIDSQRQITDFEQRSLTTLYRPLLTSDAYSLMMVLWEMSQETKSISEQYTHTILLNWLGIDLPAIVEARGRLEALGLLKTYQRKIDRRSLFLYALQAPADPVKFFKDDTLSALLLGVIGESEFDRLSHRLIKQHVRQDEFYDVSKKLGDYFQLGSSVINKPDAINQVQKSLSETEHEVDTEVINQDFDFKLLAQMLSSSFVDHQSLLENEHLIMVEQTIYGINESEMAQLIKASTSYEDNKIDPKELKSRVLNAYNGQTPVKDDGNSQPKNESIPNNALAKLTTEERAIISATYAMSPNAFIESLKAQAGGFTTAAEKRIITDLVGKGLMPISVTNFLVYYFIVDQGRPTLNKNLVEAIANDWIKNKIKTPVEALEFIRKRQEQKKNTNNNYSKNRRTIQRETLPEWATETAKTKEPKQVNPETTKKINEQLKKLRSRGKEG
ncbi:DnaD domain protein [uncultured Pediococcus sp.]|mgnify:CR=1 FL=1|uniref:replication initiation and membrane attachment family protein n=1 Tax=uncultured Pediococcus sp. TaxID=165192 RepID=UPI00259B5F65|nr:DnaD domain protein [uncultured Pediococcus sp.]